MDKKQLNDSLASIKNSSTDRIILPGKTLCQETLDQFEIQAFSRVLPIKTNFRRIFLV